MYKLWLSTLTPVPQPTCKPLYVLSVRVLSSLRWLLSTSWLFYLILVTVFSSFTSIAKAQVMPSLVGRMYSQVYGRKPHDERVHRSERILAVYTVYTVLLCVCCASAVPLCCRFHVGVINILAVAWASKTQIISSSSSRTNETNRWRVLSEMRNYTRH